MTSFARPALFSPKRSSTASEVINAYIDQHRDTYGVEPICKVLQVAPSAYRHHAARQRNPELRSDRAKRDEVLMPHIKRVWNNNLKVYGADKVWKPFLWPAVP